VIDPARHSLTQHIERDLATKLNPLFWHRLQFAVAHKLDLYVGKKRRSNPVFGNGKSRLRPLYQEPGGSAFAPAR